MAVFEIEIGGRMRTVSVEGVGAVGPDGGAFQVVLDGAPRTLTARRTDLGLSIIFEDGSSADVAVTEREAGAVLVQLPHVSVTAVVDGRRSDRSRVVDVAIEGDQRVLAPMPGRIVRVLVKPGDEVALRQGLVVVEAMKMENELVSPKAGRVKDVMVAEGVSVNAGQVLVVVG
jgi:biotin carboxyl carrier protein